jgi:chromosome segregation ATPase
MAKRPEEILAELQKQKEDIEILLSSLEEAYSEAGITEKHYKEVKTKNQKKLKDIERKIKRIEKKVGKRAKVEAKEPKTVGEMIEAEQGPVPVSKPLEGEMPAEPPTEPPAEMPKPTPVGAPPVAKPGKEKFSADDIKNMLSRFIKEIKPGGLEVLPKVEKMEVRLEKMNAFLTAIKDEKTSGDETIRRLTEEIGEIRSNIGALDRKTSQQEILVTEINTAITDLKPQKFVKFLRKEDTQVKMHDAKIQKIEDVTSLLIKRIAQVEEVLKKIGSLEKIADFGRNIAKRLVEIENREKRIGRISDRIDSIFMELNKRLDEFMLYKAKQDTLDELSREMMKAIDEMNTKVEGFAKKEDLDLLRDTLESRISGAGVVAPATSPEVMKLQEQKSEIEGLLGILEEQFKKGDLKKEEYEKAKKVNTERMERIDKKIAGCVSRSSGSCRGTCGTAGTRTRKRGEAYRRETRG